MKRVGVVSTRMPTRTLGTVSGSWGGTRDVKDDDAVLQPREETEPVVRDRWRPLLPGTAVVDDGREIRQGAGFGDPVERPAAGNEREHVHALVAIQPVLAEVPPQLLATPLESVA
jgi:hypothetical protein